MRAVLQRVKESSVTVDGVITGRIGRGLLVLLGVEETDTEKDVLYMAEKVAHLRIFGDENGKMNCSVKDAGGEVLVVSQFTLMGDCRRGRRPSFTTSARPEKAILLYEMFIREVNRYGINTAQGIFQAMMDVHLINDGPVTIMLDSNKNF